MSVLELSYIGVHLKRVACYCKLIIHRQTQSEIAEYPAHLL